MYIYIYIYIFRGRPVISDCGMYTEKISEFLDHHLKPFMKQGESYIVYKGHWRFSRKIEESRRNS